MRRRHSPVWAIRLASPDRSGLSRVPRWPTGVTPFAAGEEHDRLPWLTATRPEPVQMFQGKGRFTTTVSGGVVGGGVVGGGVVGGAVVGGAVVGGTVVGGAVVGGAVVGGTVVGGAVVGGAVEGGVVTGTVVVGPTPNPVGAELGRVTVVVLGGAVGVLAAGASVVGGLVRALVGGLLVLGVATGMNTVVVVVVVTTLLTERFLVASDFDGTEASFGTTRAFGLFVVVVERGISTGIGGKVITP